MLRTRSAQHVYSVSVSNREKSSIAFVTSVLLCSKRECAVASKMRFLRLQNLTENLNQAKTRHTTTCTGTTAGTSAESNKDVNKTHKSTCNCLGVELISRFDDVFK